MKDFKPNLPNHRFQYSFLLRFPRQCSKLELFRSISFLVGYTGGKNLPEKKKKIWDENTESDLNLR